MGYLHATPKSAELSRAAEMEKNGLDVAATMPNIKHGHYLIDHFHKMRPASPAPMGGMMPRDWSDVHVYAGSTGGGLCDWEISALFEMSQTYVTEFVRGEHPLTIPPVDRKAN